MDIDYRTSDSKIVDFSRHPSLRFDTYNMTNLFEEVRVDVDGELIVSTLDGHGYFASEDSLRELEQFARFLLAYVEWKRSD